MTEPCRYCDSERVAAVLDKKIEHSPRAGNKYRKRCLDCDRWLPMTSAAQFQVAEIQHVLPRDADSEADGCTVPVEEFDGPVEGVKTAQSPTAVTDGGEDEPENEFDCPECGSHVTGYPDECPHCGAPYNWTDG